MEDRKGIAKSNATPVISAVLDNSRDTSVSCPSFSCEEEEEEVDDDAVMTALKVLLEDCRMWLS